MVDPQTSRFWQSALHSGLIDAQGLAACWEAVPEEKRDAREHVDRRLARQAVQLRLLTLWQAQQLLAGRSSGFRVDRYLMLDLIGHGGMGRVYLARDTRLNRQVALKILAPERMNNPRAIARFQREARVGAQLQHENLVRIYDFGESQGRYYLVMELIEGKTLGAQIATEGRFAPASAARLARQVALGLDHAHRKGLIHRDVNPYNVMVTEDGTAKLADLGLAIDMTEDVRVTRDGATVGTFDYVAPEQARHSHAADIRSDIYSLGCSLYHMLAGQVPFPSPSLPEKLFSHQALEPTPLGQLAPEVPPGLVEVVARMMRKQPSERYENPVQVARALEPFLEESTTLSHLAATAGAAAASPPAGIDSSAPVGEAQARTDVATDDDGAGATMKAKASAASRAAVAAGGQVPLSEEFPVVVDLGPAPPLSDSGNRARPWFTGANPIVRTPFTSALSTPDPTPVPDPSLPEPPAYWWRRDRRVLAGGAVAALALIAAMVSLALSRGGSTLPPTPPVKKVGTPVEKKGDRSSSGAGVQGAPIVVIDRDGEEAPAADLLKAMQAALGKGGIVELRNNEPMTLQAGDKAINIAMSKRTLHLRAGAGFSPVLRVDMKGKRPFLSTGADINLVVEGLTFEAFDSTPAPKPAPTTPKPATAPVPPAAVPAAPLPPIVLAMGRARFHRCAMRWTGPGSARAIASDGGLLTVDGCWIEGFAAAIEIKVIAGRSSAIRQTMIVPGRPAATAGAKPFLAAVRTGLGVNVQFLPGGKTNAGRELKFDHCTFSGSRFLGLEGFSPAAPLDLAVNDCAVQSGALIAWAPSKPDATISPTSVRWTGEGNQLDVSGASWVVGPSGEGASPATDLDGWMKLAVERDPVRMAILFPLEPKPGGEGATPFEYAVKPTGARRPGADPAEVGPKR